jgi:hypothetical protein
MLNNSAVRTEHTLSIAAGGEDTKYYFTTNYLSQEGNVVTSKFDRVTTRLSVDTKVNSWLKSGVTMFFYIRSKFSFTKWIKLKVQFNLFIQCLQFIQRIEWMRVVI